MQIFQGQNHTTIKLQISLFNLLQFLVANKRIDKILFFVFYKPKYINRKLQSLKKTLYRNIMRHMEQKPFEQNRIEINEYLDSRFNCQITDQIADCNVVKCIRDNQVINYCYRLNCKKPYVFICNNKKCQCSKGHKKCVKGSISSVLKMINHKKELHLQIRQELQQVFQKNQTFTSQFKLDLLKLIDRDLKLITINQQEIYFYNFFVRGKQSLFINHQSLYDLQETLHIYKNSQICVLNSFKEKLKRQIQVINLKFNSQSKEKSSQMKQKQKSINVQGIDGSSIVASGDNYQKLTKFFPKKVKAMNLLFKASEHDFSLKSYYEICGDQTDTIIISTNSQDKIIGGFTPLHLKNLNRQHGQYIADCWGQSFVFSLTCNQKYKLIKKSRALNICRITNGIHFTNFFWICDKANVEPYSGFFFQKSIYESLHTQKDIKSILEVRGTWRNCFFLKQWEAIKVQFDE